MLINVKMPVDKMYKNKLAMGQEKQSLKIAHDINQIFVDLRKPRIITIIGLGSKGNKIVRHLKITDKERLVLL
jgi:hypothetical protein